ncbi:hypothetical protein [Clostridium sp. ZS2-4]|uniref:hypothetical protein n=1 Tax=Clostridium sp. ZS2-4 TaxID=2987703 RepID=UPI00227C94C9|nr:hypothetical protein [Clostridium sp. ZS2-4]MCY6355388.1 hypothetical protein [Clostridium sp. ZS2-4]
MDWREKSAHERANMISSAREEGFKEAMEEEIKEIAKRLLDMDMDIKLISRATELSVAEVQSLQQSLKKLEEEKKGMK